MGFGQATTCHIIAWSTVSVHFIRMIVNVACVSICLVRFSIRVLLTILFAVRLQCNAIPNFDLGGKFESFSSIFLKLYGSMQFLHEYYYMFTSTIVLLRIYFVGVTLYVYPRIFVIFPSNDLECNICVRVS